MMEEQILTQSYARGPAGPLLELTIGDLLQWTAERWPERPAVVSRHQERRLTWAELSAEADRAARGLWALGVRRGDRVGLWSTNCAEWVVMHMGCARAGAALVNVNPAYRSHELQFTLTRSRMKALFLWHKDKHADYEEILGRARHGLDLALEHTIYFDSPEWPALLDAEGRLPEHVAVDDIANIQYTSGTTGLPKGVMLTHRNVVNNGQFLAQGFHYTEQDKIVVPVPLFHCYGCVIGTMSAVNAGGAQSDPRRESNQRLRRSRNVRGGVCARRLCQLRLHQPAHRNDERRALPGGADEARARRDAHWRTGDCLRADGNLPGGDDERRRRFSRSAGEHGGPRHAADRDQNCRA
jgi:fatty-acyl-CoA synthase